MNKEIEKTIQIGRATYVVSRKFSGPKSLKEILEKLILSEK